MLSKTQRLSTKEIESLSLGKSVFGTLISMRFRPAPVSKVAISVSKKVAPRAVDRNRIRRRIYGALQKILGQIKSPAFLMFMPKKEFLTISPTLIEKEIMAVLEKARLL